MVGTAIRVYVDTSVFGGVFDNEFSEASRALFQQARAGRFQIVVSDLLRREIAPAPQEVNDFFIDMLEYLDIAEITEAALRLRKAYIDSGILSAKSLDDALHVAMATVSGSRIIVSWNFRHIVHFEKIPMYNEVNRAQGYEAIAIHSPLEIVEDNEDQDI